MIRCLLCKLLLSYSVCPFQERCLQSDCPPRGAARARTTPCPLMRAACPQHLPGAPGEHPQASLASESSFSQYPLTLCGALSPRQGTWPCSRGSCLSPAGPVCDRGAEVTVEPLHRGLRGWRRRLGHHCDPAWCPGRGRAKPHVAQSTDIVGGAAAGTGESRVPPHAASGRGGEQALLSSALLPYLHTQRRKLLPSPHRPGTRGQRPAQDRPGTQAAPRLTTRELVPGPPCLL